MGDPARAAVGAAILHVAMQVRGGSAALRTPWRLRTGLQHGGPAGKLRQESARGENSRAVALSYLCHIRPRSVAPTDVLALSLAARGHGYMVPFIPCNTASEDPQSVLC